MAALNTKLTLTYEGQTDNPYHHATTVTKEFFDPDFKEIYEALREMCYSLGFSPITVDKYFGENP